MCAVVCLGLGKILLLWFNRKLGGSSPTEPTVQMGNRGTKESSSFLMSYSKIIDVLGASSRASVSQSSALSQDCSLHFACFLYSFLTCFGEMNLNYV